MPKRPQNSDNISRHGQLLFLKSFFVAYFSLVSTDSQSAAFSKMKSECKHKAVRVSQTINATQQTSTWR